MINRIPEIESRPDFPQTGWHPLDVYCAATGMERRAFMENLKKLGIPHRKFGVTVFVEAEVFLNHLPVVGDAEHDQSHRH